MEELRAEIRAAFERQQATHPPSAALRRDTVATVIEHPRQAASLQWLAVAAAIVLGLAMVAGLMSSRLLLHPPAPANPKGDYGPPPSGVPLLYVRDPSHPSWLIGYDWSGKPRGTVKIGQPVASNESVIMAPDGQQFEVLEANQQLGVFLDRLGQPVSGATVADVGSGAIWADDNRHRCGAAFDTTTGEWSLLAQVRGEAPSEGLPIANYPVADRSSISVAACSFRNDVAIAVRSVSGSPYELWVIRLSDGKVLSHRTYRDPLVSVVASQDGRYVAENPGSVRAPQIPQPAIIWRVADGEQVADLGLSVQVIAFSADDSRLLVSNVMLYDNQNPARLTVLDFASGRSVWTYVGPEAFASFSVQTNGNGFAVGLMAPTQVFPNPCGGTGQPQCHQTDDPLRDVLIVHGDGSSATIPGRYQLTW